MALRRDHLSVQQRVRQEDLDRSWADAIATLADPRLRADLVDSLVRLDEREPAALLSATEFLTRSKVGAE